jgi:two-component system alkaline phosphatase synthesis response regulator PhoP
MPPKILLVEDEPDLVVTLADRLHAEGYVVEAVGDGQQGLELATSRPFDLVILDVMLPGKNGINVCRDLRQLGISVPVLMLTARSQPVDKVLALKIGADDYVTKPFDMMELLARIEALLRRAQVTSTGRTLHEFGPVVVNLRAAEVRRDGRLLPLLAREFELLRYFVEHPGMALSREELLRDVWGYEASLSTRTVDVHVARLRQKLEPDPKNPQFILTLPGIGYKFSG